MRIVNNGTESEIARGATLLAYLQNEGLADKPGIAIAVNESVVPRKDWSEFILKEGDIVLIIKATQGG